MRVHLQERRELFQPDDNDPDLPFFTAQLKPWRKSKMILAGGTEEETLEDNRTYQAVIPTSWRALDW